MPEPVAARYRATLVPGYGVQRIPHLEAFMADSARLVRSRRLSSGIDSVAGWGFKATADASRALARQHGLTYIAVEDGFFRSVGHGETGAPAVSLVVDDVGIYYDARGPSRLEQLLGTPGWETPELLARAQAALARIVAAGLSKTNTDPPLAPDQLPRDGRRRVLVVDQTHGDASIAGALATTESFAAMQAAARRDEPDAEIVVRRHPLVAAGLKQGCLPASELEGAVLMDQPARAADVLRRVDIVYTVSSLMGFEALLREIPVRCFGVPFYANWGLSDDEIVSPRRGRRRSLVELFAAACLLYARYVDPLTGQACGIETALDRLLLMRDHSDANAGYTAAVGFSRWKRNTTRRLLASSRGSVEFHETMADAQHAAATKAGRVVIWGGRETRDLTRRLGASLVPLCRMEDGFIRSAGLGSDLVLAASAVLDDRGIYYDPARPSRLEHILQTTHFDPATLARAGELRRLLVEGGVTKYNVGGVGPDLAADGRRRILVVGQVEDDQSILRGCRDIRTNLGLLEAARADYPDAFLLYKPHPDVALGTRAGVADDAAVRRHADAVIEGADIATVLRSVDGIATMTSLSGFEALLRGLPVRTYGLPFYAGWGLTEDRHVLRRRTRRLTLDELVAGVLIFYPIYIDPVTGLPCPVEHLVRHLAGEARRAPRPRALRMLSGLWEGFRPFRANRF